MASGANGITTLDGNPITAATAFDGSVDGQFQITNGGQTLSIINPAAKPTGVLKGDLNLDTVVNFADISPFIMVLSTNGDQPEGDTNCDGIVNFGDIATFIMILASS